MKYLKYVLLLLLIYGTQAVASPEAQTAGGRYVATAYDQSGTTASGVQTQRHIVAADPDILPIGSRIKVRHAGRYSGEYVVADTGEKIVGRRLDIYIPNSAACKKFGRKNVRVKVITLGDNTHKTTKEAEKAVAQDVKQDLQDKVVGNAATETDWAVHHSTAKQAGTSTSQTNSSPDASSSDHVEKTEAK